MSDKDIFKSQRAGPRSNSVTNIFSLNSIKAQVCVSRCMVYFRPLHTDPINSCVSLTSDGFQVLLLLSWHFARIGQLLSRDDALGLP